MVAFIDQHRNTYGVEPICAVLPIAPSTYFLRKAQQQDTTKRSAPARRDAELCAAIQRVWDDHEQVYGPRKVWKQLRREGQALTDRDQKRLFEAARSKPEWIFAYVASALAFYCGLRACEIRGLQWKHVDWDNARIQIRRSKTPCTPQKVDPTEAPKRLGCVRLGPSLRGPHSMIAPRDPHGVRSRQ